MSASPQSPTPGPAPADAERVPGAIRVRERVIDKVVREAAADQTGVPRGEVSVDVAEWGGGLAVRVSGRIPVPDLDDAAAISAGPPVLARVHDVQRALATELARVTGREIRRVSFTVTGAIIPERKRVR